MVTLWHSPLLWAGTAAAAILAASVACGWLCRSLLADSFGRTTTREILAGLAAATPSLLVAALAARWAKPQQAASVGIASAVTYLLLGPVVLAAIAMRCSNAWQTWRRAVLPFALAAAAMWFVTATGGQFSHLHGQFFVTLFILGTWLFTLDRSPAAEPLDRAGETGPEQADPPSGRPAQQPGGHPPGLWRPAVIAVVATAAFATLALAVTGLGGSPAVGRLMPLAGAVACVGPLLAAARSRSAMSERWLGTFGVAVMACCCLVPGIAGMLQAGRTSAGLYGPDGAVLALAAALWLGMGDEASRGQPIVRVAAVAAWCIWVVWIVSSAA